MLEVLAAEALTVEGMVVVVLTLIVEAEGGTESDDVEVEEETVVERVGKVVVEEDEELVEELLVLDAVSPLDLDVDRLRELIGSASVSSLLCLSVAACY